MENHLGEIFSPTLPHFFPFSFISPHHSWLAALSSRLPPLPIDWWRSWAVARRGWCRWQRLTGARARPRPAADPRWRHGRPTLGLPDPVAAGHGTGARSGDDGHGIARSSGGHAAIGEGSVTMARGWLCEDSASSSWWWTLTAASASPRQPWWWTHPLWPPPTWASPPHRPGHTTLPLTPLCHHDVNVDIDAVDLPLCSGRRWQETTAGMEEGIFFAFFIMNFHICNGSWVGFSFFLSWILISVTAPHFEPLHMNLHICNCWVGMVGLTVIDVSFELLQM